MPAIEVNHLTKEYRLGALQGLKQTVLNAGAWLAGRRVEQRPLFKALDDVSFSIDPGEVVGIIGHNGAGKSTLLKMLARITTPTLGSVKVNGRIAPLIEVGAGFIPDFTGRENVYLNGSIMGMSKKEIDRKFDEIVDFAEVDEFIDTPVKRYSSGMQVKLAFAVATSIESEILIVDEVLAVGDLAFQRKCFDRMEQIIRSAGRTVLLVSHNIRQVERMCTRAILLEHGHVALDGSALEVCEAFYEQNNRKIEYNQNVLSRARIDESGEVRLLNADIINENGDIVRAIVSGDALCARFQFELLRDFDDLEIIVGTHRTDFVYVSAASTRQSQIHQYYAQGLHEVVCRIGSYPLVAGTYSLRLSILDKNFRRLFGGESLYTFLVQTRVSEPLNDHWKLVELASEFSIDGVRKDSAPRSLQI